MSKEGADVHKLFHKPTVDEQEEPQKYINAMDSMREWSLMDNQKNRSIEQLRLGLGNSVVDIGCGTGEEVVSMGRIVGREGRSVGIDVSKTMLAEAARRAKDLALPIEFFQGDIYALQFDDETFDASRAERVFEHLEYPEKALGKMLRVTKKGGRLAAISPDTDGHVFDFPDQDLARKFIHFTCDDRVNGWAGRRLYGMFVDAGLREVTCEAFVHIIPWKSFEETNSYFEKLMPAARESGALTAEETERFMALLTGMRGRGTFLYSTPNYLVAGTKV